MSGRLLSVETMVENDVNFLVAKQIMTDSSKTTIFLGNYDNKIWHAPWLDIMLGHTF